MVSPDVSASDCIYHRALIMGLLAVRFTIEFVTKHHGVIETSGLYTVDQIRHILDRSQPLRAMVTPKENKLFHLDIGEWSEDLLIRLSWSSEYCGCLLWAVGELQDFAPHDTAFGLGALHKYFQSLRHVDWALPFSYNHVILRDAQEMLRMKKRAEVLFQRYLFAAEIRYKKRHLPRLKTYDDIFHFSQLGLPIGPSGDLIVLDKEFCDLSETDEHGLFPLALSRIHAFQWLSDPKQAWDNVSLDFMYTLPQ